MKKNIIFIICGLFIFSIFINVLNIYSVGADSGFDSSYDSGGSYSGSGSSWDSDSSDGRDADPACILMFPYLFWSIIGLIISFKNFNNIKKSKLRSILFFIIYILSLLGIIIIECVLIENKLDIITVLICENILLFPIIFSVIPSLKNKPKQKIIKGIDNKKIVTNVFEIFKELQIAWMNFDYDKIKELVSDEMYNMYTNQLETLKIKNQQNLMSDIEFIEGYITDYKKINKKETFKIYLSVSCYDYIINKKNNKVLRGDKHKKLTLSYILTFENDINIVKHCPQCGADINNLTECNYCKTKIVNNTFKMKMTKKEIISQK